MTGTTLAQALPIAILPILSRLYSPDDFGVLAIFVSLSFIFGSVANGRYELAIILPKSDLRALTIVRLSVIVAFILSFILFVLIFFFQQRIIGLLDNNKIGPWLYFIPLVVFLSGLFNALNYYHTRTKSFKTIAKANVYKTLTSSSVQLIFGFIKPGVGGLISGNLLSHVSANLKLLYKLLNNQHLLSRFRFADIKSEALRYSDFPKFTMWATLANNLSSHLINLFIPILYSITTLGHYSYINRVLGLPMTLVSKSVGQVFIQQASEERKKYGSAHKILTSTILKLFSIAFPIFFVLYFVIEDLYRIVFGTQWAIAGTYAKILLPLFLVRFVLSPVSVTFSVFEKQKLALVWQILLLLLALISFALSILLNLSFAVFLQFFNWALFANYILLYFMIYNISKGEIKGKSTSDE